MAALSECRNDIFLSFHGSEPLWKLDDGETYTMRDLVSSILREKRLQKCWTTEKGRVGILNVFFDDKELTNSQDGFIKKRIIDGLLQTRGGGVVVIIASKGYFLSKWCLFELLAARSLCNEDGVRLCFIAAGISAEEIEEQTRFLEDHGFAEKFQYHFTMQPDGTSVGTRDSIARELSDWILDRGSSVMAGRTVTNCRKTLVIETARAVGRNDDCKAELCVALGIDGQKNLLQELNKLCDLDPRSFLEDLNDHLDATLPSDEITAIRAKVDCYERKWNRELEWDHSRQSLDGYFDEASAAAHENSIKITSQEGSNAFNTCDGNTPPNVADPIVVSPVASRHASVSSSSSSDGSAEFVGVDFSTRINQTWNDFVHDLGENIENQCRQLAQFGTTVHDFGDSSLEVSVKRMKCGDSHKTRVALKLTWKVELYDDLAPSEHDEVCRICRCIAELLGECGATKKDIERYMIGSLWKSSLCMILEADESVVERLYDKFVEANWNLPIGYDDITISGLSPAYGVKMPTQLNATVVPNDQSPDAWLFKQDQVQIIFPRSEFARSCIMEKGIHLSELTHEETVQNAVQSLPLIRLWEEKGRLMDEDDDNRAHNRKTLDGDERKVHVSKGMVEVESGRFVRVHGVRHAESAIAKGQSIIVQCSKCQHKFQVDRKAGSLYCTHCKSVTKLHSRSPFAEKSKKRKSNRQRPRAYDL